MLLGLAFPLNSRLLGVAVKPKDIGSGLTVSPNAIGFVFATRLKAILGLALLLDPRHLLYSIYSSYFFTLKKMLLIHYGAQANMLVKIIH
jgi:hypothetical protein